MNPATLDHNHYTRRYTPSGKLLKLLRPNIFFLTTNMYKFMREIADKKDNCP